MDFVSNKVPASGVAKGGLTTGIIGTSLGALALLGTGANGIAGLFGGGQRNNNSGLAQAYLDGLLVQSMQGGTCGCQKTCTCESDHLVTRYDAEKDAKIAHLETQVALRDADTYTDRKILDLYEKMNARFTNIEGVLAQQAVNNQAVNDKFALAAQQQECCCERLSEKIKAEAAARCCGDNSIVNYANATFYPQMIADITVGTTAKAQSIWNPVTNCGCCCD